MKDEVYEDKLKSKLKHIIVNIWESPILGTSRDYVGFKSTQDPKIKKGRTEGHHKHKGCICGTHSIRGHKQHWKYPPWRREKRRPL